MQRTLQQNVYHEIRDKLTDGCWGPGEKLSEAKLAKELGVNRNPVREALLKLASEGLLERTPNLGCRVALVNTQSLIYIYQLREALETAAARLAATTIQSAQLLEIEHQNNLMKHYSQANDTKRSAEHDNVFHKMLIELSSNPILLEVWNQQRIRVIFSKNILSEQNNVEMPKRDPNIAIKAHEKIIAALRKGNPDEAEIAVRTHISHAWRTLKEKK